MDTIESFFRSGRIADVVIVVMVLEGLAFALAARLRARKWALSSMLTGLLPGFFLVLALKAALMQTSTLWIAAALSAALMTHLFDLRNRLTTPHSR